MPLLQTRADASAQGYGFLGATSTGAFYQIQQLSPSAVSTITFSSIPSTYKSLQVRFNLIVSVGTTLAIQFNGDAGSNYAWHYIAGTGSAASGGGTASTTSMGLNVAGVTNAVTTYPNVGIIDVIDYANANKNKVTKTLFGGNNNTSTGPIEINSGLWLNTAAITSLTLFVGSGTFTGTITLYGAN